MMVGVWRVSVDWGSVDGLNDWNWVGDDWGGFVDNGVESK